MAELDRVVSDLFRPFIAGAIIVAFFASPSLKYYDPIILYIGGMALALGVFLVNYAISLSEFNNFKRVTIIGTSLTGIAFISLIGGAIPAQSLSTHLDAQCAILQTDMLSLKQARSDSRELFSALGCRPQMAGTLKLPSGHGWIQRDGMILHTKAQ